MSAFSRCKCIGRHKDFFSSLFSLKGTGFSPYIKIDYFDLF